MNTLELVVLALAVWRLSHLIAHKEKGPFRIIWNFHLWVRRQARKYPVVRKSEVLEGLECEYCLSIWFGAVVGLGYYFLGTLAVWAVLPLALSAGSLIVKHVVFTLKSIDTHFDLKNQQHREWKKYAGVDYSPALFENQINGKERV